MGLPPTNTWVQTFSGVAFQLDDPTPEMVNIEDIAHHLSMLCRYAGAVRSFYSVAEHCVRAYRYAKERGWSADVCLATLLHDAAESYIIDLPTPIKRLLPAYQELEHRVESAVATKFGLKVEDLSSEKVKFADATMLATEKRDLLTPCERQWSFKTLEPLPEVIVPVTSADAEAFYLQRFFEASQRFMMSNAVVQGTVTL